MPSGPRSAEVIGGSQQVEMPKAGPVASLPADWFIQSAEEGSGLLSVVASPTG